MQRPVLPDYVGVKASRRGKGDVDPFRVVESGNVNKQQRGCHAVHGLFRRTDKLEVPATAMDFEYSPHRSVVLLSPTHPHTNPMHGFVSMETIRQSMSRSPSKLSKFKVRTASSPVGSPGSPLSPSFSRSFSANAAADPRFASPYACPSLTEQPPASVKSSKFSLRRAMPLRASSRRTSPNAPLRRALSDTISQGNTLPPPSSLPRASGEENSKHGSVTGKQETDITAQVTRFELDDEPIKFEILKARAEDSSAGIKCHLPVKSSPLKRSDGIMNLDQASLGSPRAKRRSLHSVNFGSDFNVFDQGILSNKDPHASSMSSTFLRRTSPQRRTIPLRSDFLNILPHRTAPKPHPLSKALTPSSSTSSMADDSSTHDPPIAVAPARPSMIFSASLPIGAGRPATKGIAAGDVSSADSVATPDAYKTTKPLPAAFMSTGLISKRNRNIDQPSGFFASVNMPDTPSKKFNNQPMAFSPTPAKLAASRGFNASYARHEFGTPTKPLNSHPCNVSPESFGKGVSIFGSQTTLPRRGSFASLESEDHATLPAGQVDSQSSNDELPPTPTKQTSGQNRDVWAVKKTKKPFTGSIDKKRKRREVQVLKALRGHEHIIDVVDTWESGNHLYIQTEFCENGNLKDFLEQAGYKARLDDFRIWKILLEMSQGIKFIHDSGFIHLDLKPANVFIDWEGVLKIGDFGMASSWPAPSDIDGEGDREYIGPEILSGRFDKPADIFALGMIMLEIASNCVLPDNGSSWQKLRAGDLSDLPSLTFSSDSDLVRDESGDPVDLLRNMRAHDLVQPPNFMVDSRDTEALDNVVQWMISPLPESRPIINEILNCGGVLWVGRRRRAGATVFEGNWGPADDVLADQDVDMMDVC
ncbi:WEE protein kinase [Cryomyces antarcticus]